MKKVSFMYFSFIVAFFASIFVSCDRKYNYNYYIINSCDEEIRVVLIDYEDKSSLFRIKPKQEHLVCQGVGYSFMELCTIVCFAKNITITKGDNTSKINYIDNDLWGQKSKTQENVYLTITPEDFD